MVPVADSRGGGGGRARPPAVPLKIFLCVKFMRVKGRKGRGHRACSFCPFCIPPVVVN